MRVMNALKHIRKNLFQAKQQEFAQIAGVQQSTVSRWENGSGAPTLEEMQRIRSAALAAGLVWDDRLFFDVPETDEAA